jgi:hypothetical protein
MLWSASVTDHRAKNTWEEKVYAESVRVYYDKDTAVPQSTRLDF